MGDNVVSNCEDEQLSITDCANAVSHSAQRLLHASAYRSLRQLRCDYRDGVLTIQGEVPTFFLKQVAQTIAAGVEGVQSVANRTHVTY